MPIGHYTRLSEIGRGSFAVVYKGVHTVSWDAVSSDSYLCRGSGLFSIAPVFSDAKLQRLIVTMRFPRTRDHAPMWQSNRLP